MERTTGAEALTLDEFTARARDWLAARLPVKTSPSSWGMGPDDVGIFHALSAEAESTLIERARNWHREKAAAGYGAISLPPEFGGLGLPAAYTRAFRREEARFVTPPSHEVLTVTTVLVAGALRLVGTEEQKRRFLPPFIHADEICCQLFSEPGAGSDLASVATRGIRDGEDWILTGQKVWSSGARDAQWGIALCRTDPALSKHAGLTMVLVPMDAPGVLVRPIRQMNGGASFSEVFLDGVRVPDGLRVGEERGGWKVALSVLGFERGGGEARGGTYQDVLQLARWLGRTGDPVVRQKLARLYTQRQVMAVTSRRAAAVAAASQPPGPEGSIIKLLFTQHQQSIAETVESLLGARLIADSGEWGTFAWAAFLLGVPGNRIAGGTDEIQRNVISERVLGLPREASHG